MRCDFKAQVVINKRKRTIACVLYLDNSSLGARTWLPSRLPYIVAGCGLTFCDKCVISAPFSQQEGNGPIDERLLSLRGSIWPQIWHQWPKLPTYPCHVYIVYTAPFGGSEATTASNQPQRSNLTSDLKSVTSIRYFIKVSRYPYWSKNDFIARRRRIMIHWLAPLSRRS